MKKRGREGQEGMHLSTPKKRKNKNGGQGCSKKKSLGERESEKAKDLHTFFFLSLYFFCKQSKKPSDLGSIGLKEERSENFLIKKKSNFHLSGKEPD